MNSPWEQFLQQRGGSHGPSGSWQFTGIETEKKQVAKGSFLCDLSSLSWLQIDGADAESFLHGQLTTDLQNLDSEHHQLSAFCNPKGRVLCLFRVFRWRQQFVAQIDKALADAVAQRLSVYVLRADVKLTPKQGWVSLGVTGTNVLNRLEEVLGPVPRQDNGLQVMDGELMLLVHPSASEPRVQLLGPPARLESLWSALHDTYPAVGEWAWRWFDIRAGIPRLLPDNVEAFIPQMINLDLVGAISFSKGCYPGQEIVARTHYLGKLKQRMVLGHLEKSLPVAGEALYTSSFGEQRAGTVVDAQPSPSGGYDLLAVVQLRGATEDQLHVGDPNGEPMALQDLPYPLALLEQQQA